MNSMEELTDMVVVWGIERGILVTDRIGDCVKDEGRARAQLLKCVSELGEISDAVLKGDSEAQLDGLGDVLVTLIMFAGNSGMTLRGALSASWEEIKDRRGKTVGGTFVKEGDK